MQINPAARYCDHYLAPLRIWLNDPKTRDVAVNRPGEVWVRTTSWTSHEVPELTLFWLENLAINAGSLRQQEIGTHAPILDTEISDNLRYNAILHPHVDLGLIANTIRRHEESVAPIEAMTQRYRTDGWNEFTITSTTPTQNKLLALYRSGDIVAFLKAAVRARKNIVLLGPTGAGKTTLLKTLAAEIPPTKRIVTLEDAQEIKLPYHPNKLQLLFPRDTGIDRAGAEKLARAALRMHPDVVIIGELRGDEAWTYVGDILPPHPGSLVTTHGNSADSGFMRIFGLCRANSATSNMDDRTLARFMANVIDIIAPLYEDDAEQDTGTFRFRPVWFADEARERGARATELMWEN